MGKAGELVIRPIDGSLSSYRLESLRWKRLSQDIEASERSRGEKSKRQEIVKGTWALERSPACMYHRIVSDTCTVLFTKLDEMVSYWQAFPTRATGHTAMHNDVLASCVLAHWYEAQVYCILSETEQSLGTHVLRSSLCRNTRTVNGIRRCTRCGWNLNCLPIRIVYFAIQLDDAPVTDKQPVTISDFGRNGLGQDCCWIEQPYG